MNVLLRVICVKNQLIRKEMKNGKIDFITKDVNRIRKNIHNARSSNDLIQDSKKTSKNFSFIESILVAPNCF